MPRFRFILALLMTISIALVSYTSSAETVIHGVSIPTVEHDSGPAFRVCTATGSFWQQNGNGAYGVGYCFPRGSEGVRLVTVPEEVAKALEVIGKSVFFDHDSFYLATDAMNSIMVVKAWMRNVPTARLSIAGHTDATGTDTYNEALSESRARAVADLLTFHGVDPTQIDVQWFGESDLLISTLDRNRANRRVLLTITFSE